MIPPAPKHLLFMKPSRDNRHSGQSWTDKSIPGIGNVNGVYPPDTEGAVGPDHYFQMINLSFAIWDKNGTKLYGPVDNSTLWEGFIGAWTGSNDGDPPLYFMM